MQYSCDLKLPVAVAHVGCVTVPAVGAAGERVALTTIVYGQYNLLQFREIRSQRHQTCSEGLPPVWIVLMRYNCNLNYLLLSNMLVATLHLLLSDGVAGCALTTMMILPMYIPLHYFVKVYVLHYGY
jgi:hypothetical protein